MSQLSNPVVTGNFASGPGIVENTWVTVRDEAEWNTTAADAQLIVTLPLWTAHREALIARSAAVGVQLAPADDPAALVADLAKLAVIAVEFPAFTDGRGYSTARLLRERYGYAGQLRAVGDVQRDQVFYLLRVGFDAFVPAPGKTAEDLTEAWTDFREAYQTSVERPVPVYNRRAEALAALEPRP